jgi:hypothetical protein
MTRSWVRFAGVSAMVLGLAACGGDDEASCVVPELRVEAAEPAASDATVLSPGAKVTVAGEHFGDGCIPVEGEGEPVPPLTQIRLFVVQGDSRTSVAQVSAREGDLGFEVVVGLPSQLRTGPAKVVAQRSLDEDAPVLAEAELDVTA